MTTSFSNPNRPQSKNLIQLFASISLQEWITAAVIAAALGVAYFGFTLLYEAVKPFLKPIGLKYLTSGLWLLTPVMLGYMIRKPGIALFASCLAAFVEGTYSQWGIAGTVLYGFIQGIGVELVFALFLYRKWSFSVLALAATVSATISYLYDYRLEYTGLSVGFNLIQWAGFVVSGIVLAAGLGQFLTHKLYKTGLLDNFLIAHDHP